MKRIFQLVLMVLLVSIPFTACSTKNNEYHSPYPEYCH